VSAWTAGYVTNGRLNRLWRLVMDAVVLVIIGIVVFAAAVFSVANCI
jgi:hypothetical protein